MNHVPRIVAACAVPHPITSDAGLGDEVVALPAQSFLDQDVRRKVTALLAADPIPQPLTTAPPIASDPERSTHPLMRSAMRVEWPRP
jgi:hypothetical protein